MRFARRKLTHFRFEPEVDQGTAYAFDYNAGKLVVGRRNMHRLLLGFSDGERELQSLGTELIRPDAPSEEAYASEAALLTDLLRLVNAEVLQVVEGSSPSGAEAGSG